MSRRSIGILGGTFNPIHTEHIRLAEEAAAAFDLKEVLLIPSGESYLKKGTGVLPKEIRYEMCLLATKGRDRLRVSDMEIKREGNSYTCDTIKALREQDPTATYYFIAGTDTLESIDSWRDPGYIFHNCVFLAAARDDVSMDDIKKRIIYYEGRYNAVIRIMRDRGVSLSSSFIRRAISEGDYEVARKFLDPSVYDYIREKGLYVDNG